VSDHPLKPIIAHFRAEFAFNLDWVRNHISRGQLEAAERRLEHCEKLQDWIAALLDIVARDVSRAGLLAAHSEAQRQSLEVGRAAAVDDVRALMDAGR
jgi:hypothetical protein